jgi:hypothetical protein
MRSYSIIKDQKKMLRCDGERKTYVLSPAQAMLQVESCARTAPLTRVLPQSRGTEIK